MEENSQIKNSKNAEQLDPMKIMGNIYEKEELIIPDDPIKEDYESSESQQQIQNYQISYKETVFMAEGENNQDMNQTNELEERLFRNYQQWKKSKTAKRLKKKIKPLLEIYRDENYFTEDRYTDDEDYNYSNY